MKNILYTSMILIVLTFIACEQEPLFIDISEEDQFVFDGVFGGRIDFNNLENYANQSIPNYITKDNTRRNEITDAEATLGRILFYDKQLSSDFSTSCASCHEQSNAFGSNDALSQGVNGLTGRHSMRLVNARFSNERKFFWDERAENLEEQTTMPIRDHAEMGFSGQNGDLSFDDLIDRLSGDEIYPSLFRYIYGSPTITEERMQNSLAQFIRSIQSFDSKYDRGLNQVNNPNQQFPNFTDSENRGKQLFMSNPNFTQGANRIGGGLGCQRCHSAPEFDIVQNSRNNGIITQADGTGQDLNITRSPSLRNMFNANGQLISQLMHTGSFTNMEMVIDHYNNIDATGNNNLDNRLMRNGVGQKLNITDQEKSDLISFLKTLSGQDVFENSKWGNPFNG